jgi:hypothetical protein
LIEPYADRLARPLVRRLVAQLPDQEIERPPLPDDAVENLHEQRPVERGEPVLLQRVVEHIVRELRALLPAHQRLDTSGSGIRGHTRE